MSVIRERLYAHPVYSPHNAPHVTSHFKNFFV